MLRMASRSSAVDRNRGSAMATVWTVQPTRCDKSGCLNDVKLRA